MNIDENLDWLYRLRSDLCVYMPNEWLIPMNNALDKAIKALKQYGVLQEIWHEINKYLYDNGYDDKCRTDVFNIIDKYIGESEDKE